MIMSDLVTDLILKMDIFMTKKGQDLSARKELIAAINRITGEDSLDTIYVNNIDNSNIPDVAVIPLYHNDFNIFLMDSDLSNVCPFGYTVEIHQRCFTEFTAEELTAVVLHDILQNVQSCTAKARFIKAYNSALQQYNMDDILTLFDDISNSEVVFMAYMDICTRPFRVPIMEYDYIGTDEVLKNMKLGDAYDSYLNKTLYNTKRWVNRDNTMATPEALIDTETRNDHRLLKTILSACMDKDIRHYYAMVRNGVPLVTLDHIFGSKHTVASLGFISRKRNFKKRLGADTDHRESLTESFINPKNEIELRFQVDKIIAEMRYAETEAEREVILYKIKNLTIKLAKTRMDLEKQMKKNPADKAISTRLEYVQNFLDELEMLREKTVKMEIKPRKFGLFISYPKGYEDDGPLPEPNW